MDTYLYSLTNSKWFVQADVILLGRNKERTEQTQPASFCQAVMLHDQQELSAGLLPSLYFSPFLIPRFDSLSAFYYTGTIGISRVIPLTEASPDLYLKNNLTEEKLNFLSIPLIMDPYYKQFGYSQGGEPKLRVKFPIVHQLLLGRYLVKP